MVISVALCLLDSPQPQRFGGQVGHRHLSDGHAVPHNTHRGAVSATAQRHYLRRLFASKVVDVHVGDRRQRGNIIQQFQIA